MREMEFWDLEVWKKAKEAVILIYRLTRDFPKEERFGLADQLRRSSNSICANISEGFSRYHAKDKVRFYYNSRGSISESMNHVVISRDLGYMKRDSADRLLAELSSIRKMLNGLIRSISSSPYFNKK